MLKPFEVLGWNVRGDDDAFVGIMQGIEGMEELVQGSFLAAQELDVVDQEDIHLPIASVELGDLPVPLGGILEGVNELVGEFLGVDVSHPERRILDQGVIPDGIEQVGLAQARTAVNTERVEILPGSFGHGQGDGSRETVGVAGDEGVKGRVLVEMGFGVPLHPVLTHGELGDREGLVLLR